MSCINITLPDVMGRYYILSNSLTVMYTYESLSVPSSLKIHTGIAISLVDCGMAKPKTTQPTQNPRPHSHGGIPLVLSLRLARPQPQHKLTHTHTQWKPHKYCVVTCSFTQKHTQPQCLHNFLHTSTYKGITHTLLQRA